MELDLEEFVQWPGDFKSEKYDNVSKEEVLSLLYHVCLIGNTDHGMKMKNTKKKIRNYYQPQALFKLKDRYNVILIVNKKGKETILVSSRGYITITSKQDFTRVEHTIEGFISYTDIGDPSTYTDKLITILATRDNGDTLSRTLASLMFNSEVDPIIINLEVCDGFVQESNILSVSEETLDDVESKELVRASIISMEVKDEVEESDQDIQ